MPSIRTLKTFLAVARCGTFAAAGKQIGLTPAAVGLQIRALEEDLNCQLFDRNARAAILNPAGRALVPELEALVQRYEALASGREDGLSGTVAIGALVSVLMGALVGLVSLIPSPPAMAPRPYGVPANTRPTPRRPRSEPPDSPLPAS